MLGLAAIFVADSRRKVAAALLALLSFVLVFASGAVIGSRHVAQLVEAEAGRELTRFTQLKRNAIATMEILHREVTAEPCGPVFSDQLRAVAFLPDGISEFFYAPGGKAQCSTKVARFDPPVDFGRPDMPAEDNEGRALWLDRDLDFASLSGLQGHLVGSEPFALVVPRHDLEPLVPHWLNVEMVIAAPSGEWWHRSGRSGVYRRVLERMASPPPAARFGAVLDRLHCDGRHCVAASAERAALIAEKAPQIALLLIVSLAIAGLVGAVTLRLVRKYWAFESRFVRNLDSNSVVCAYQPVLEVASGSIRGCEVLVRWRDLDGTIVPPDRFLPIVEQRGLSMRLTELVVEKAYEELGAIVPRGGALQVSFNIFPRDLDHRRLIPLFGKFLADRERFALVVEITECEEMPLAVAQAEIEALLAAGIFTHIDDFGVGYSNIHNLAALSVHAVKLDRAFAMAEEGEMLERMLLPAIAMIRTCGHRVCVEGVESGERLDLLSTSAGADFVQGYHISRPLPAEAFGRFLAANGVMPPSLEHAA